LTISGYKAAADALAKNDLFTEQGNQGEAVDHGKPDAKASYAAYQAKKYPKATQSK